MTSVNENTRDAIREDEKIQNSDPNITEARKDLIKTYTSA